jgi:hypothetical protein
MTVKFPFRDSSGPCDLARQALAKSLAALYRPQILNTNATVGELVEDLLAVAAGRQTRFLLKAETGINQSGV